MASGAYSPECVEETFCELRFAHGGVTFDYRHTLLLSVWWECLEPDVRVVEGCHHHSWPSYTFLPVSLKRRNVLRRSHFLFTVLSGKKDFCELRPNSILGTTLGHRAQFFWLSSFEPSVLLCVRGANLCPPADAPVPPTVVWFGSDTHEP